MIPRYSKPEMTAIWTQENKYKIWFEIEAYAAQAMAKIGKIPEGAAKDIWEKGQKAIQNVDVEAIDHIEQEVKHDVIAFLTWLGQHMGDESRFVHQGMTSSDVLDTCLAVQLNQACDLLIKQLDLLLEALKKRAVEHKHTACMGRSHGIHAEPTSFGLKLLTFYAEFSRNKARLLSAQKEIATCAISGAVGTFATLPPSVEEYVAEKLGLSPEPISTQVIARDRHAMLFSVFGVIASSIERLAVEIRHLQRTEVREVEEFFSKGQKGSSAMPHKRNPILTENLTGIARYIRSTTLPAMENVALWHERDISHSSVERIICPDATIALHFALVRLTGVMENLLIYPEQMTKNLNQLSGLYNSQKIMLALTQKGISREDAYIIVQNSAMQVWQDGKDFKTLLSQDENVQKHLSVDEINNLFSLDPHLENVEIVFARVLNS